MMSYQVVVLYRDLFELAVTEHFRMSKIPEM